MAALPSTILVVLLVLVLALPAASASAAPDRRSAAPGWITLFDGRTTKGWAMTGPGRFRVRDGALVSSGGMGLLWYTKRRFRNFELMLDWRVAEQCDNSGVFVRFPGRPRSPADAVNSGYEVQIDDCDPRGLTHRTGSIYDHAAATRLVSRSAGRWNRYRIRVVGQHYMVFLNGALVTQLHGARAQVGYIGLQNHDPGSRVSFRRIRARLLR